MKFHIYCHETLHCSFMHKTHRDMMYDLLLDRFPWAEGIRKVDD